MNASPCGVTRLPSLMTYPASCNSALALRSKARSWPDPSDTGGTKGSPNTSSGTLPRKARARRSPPVPVDHRHHVRILENGTGSLIGPVHDGGVRPFEIECVDEGLAQALVLEFLPSRVEVPALRRDGVWSGTISRLTRPSRTAGNRSASPRPVRPIPRETDNSCS